MESLQGKRILIVEDNVTNLAVFVTALKRHGAIVIQDVRNLETADLVSKHLPIDLILLDIMLRHGITGYDIIDQLKAHPALTHIPVVAISSLDPEIEIPKAKAKGFSGFISKPINLRDFPNQLADCMAGKQVWIISR